MMKDKEVSFKCGSEFNNLTKLKLQLSNDSKYILLPVVSSPPEDKLRANKFQKIELLVWEASNLNEKKFPLMD